MGRVVATALLAASLAACASTSRPQRPTTPSTPVGTSNAPRAARAEGITGAGSLADGIEVGGVAPALDDREAGVLDAVHASNHPPRPSPVANPMGSERGWRGGLKDTRGPSLPTPVPGATATTVGAASEVGVRIIQTRLSTMQRCYAKERAVDPQLAGALTVEIRRGPGGGIYAATATPRRGGPFSAAIISCIEDVFIGMSADAEGSPETFTFELTMTTD